jgi:membrane protein implicated in regulation of membrane protease activity
MIATWLGLAAGFVAWRLTRGSAGMLGWVLPLVYSFLAFSFVSAIGVMFTADLRSKPPEPLAEPAHASGGHGPHH